MLHVMYDTCINNNPGSFEGELYSLPSYEDFVWFILSEEDKTSETSLEYWYNVFSVFLFAVIWKYHRVLFT